MYPTQTLTHFNQFGILPLGNALIHGSHPSRRLSGLGTLSKLPDELLLQIFTDFEPKDLICAQSVSQIFFAWCAAVEGFWKVALLQKSKGHFPSWEGSWRRTYLFWARSRKRSLDVDPTDTNEGDLPSDAVRLSGVYSDVIYLPYRCAAFQPSSIFHGIDSTDKENNKRKRRKIFKQNISCISGMNTDSSSLPKFPVILSGLMDSWNANSSSDESKGNICWKIDALKRRFPNVKFQAESAQIPLDRYTEYMSACENDESPVYLFDADFVEKTSSLKDENGKICTNNINSDDGDDGLGSDYIVPEVFGQDLLDYMDEDERPDFRWLIIGPARSGSTWHQDPNGTSAWNAVVEGEKGWILFPPDVIPPGVFVSEDHAQVQSPLSVAEWLQSYYEIANEEYGPEAKDPLKRGIMRQGVCLKGEIVYIPSGWWHLVVNLSDSIAVTQNFVSRREIGSVLQFMRSRPEQVSGFGRGKRRRRRLESALHNTNELSASPDQDIQEDNDCDETQFGVFDHFCNVLSLNCPDILNLALSQFQDPVQRSSKSLWDKLLNHPTHTEDKVICRDETIHESENNFKFSFDI